MKCHQQTDMKPLFLACIPDFNEEKTIAGVIVSAMRHVDGFALCDDGSRDMIGEVANGRDATLDPRVWMGE